MVSASWRMGEKYLYSPSRGKKGRGMDCYCRKGCYPSPVAVMALSDAEISSNQILSFSFSPFLVKLHYETDTMPTACTKEVPVYLN